MRKIFTSLFVVLLATIAVAQKDLEKTLSGYVNPEELISLSETIPFDKAVEVLSKVSEKLTGKRIVSTAGITAPIGIEIDKMPYKKALLIIVQYQNLEYEERENVIVIKKKFDPSEGLTEDVYAPVEAREVKISAVFFEANITDMREHGINWEFLLSKDGLSLGSNLKTFLVGKQTDDGTSSQNSQQEPPPDFQSNSESQFDLGNFAGNATAAFKFWETNNLGEIIAMPNITVRDKNKGRIQIGSDISIKQRDFAGNVIDVFVSTGTIIDVTPYIYNEDGIDYVLLKLHVERSSAQPDVISTVINKTQAETEVLMLNGEEVIIGGLFINEESNVRRGIPILKDLPWWVFGIRYLTGYDQTQTVKKEVVILLKTELVKPLKDRVEESKMDRNLVNEDREQNQKRLQKYSTQNNDEE